MTITFKDLREATGDIVKQIIGPTDLRELKTLARQLTSSYQQSIPMVLAKVEQKLNWFAYTLGDLELDDLPDNGTETFFILTVADQEIVKNAFITLSWDKMAAGVSGAASDLRPDGSSLQYTVKVDVKEVSPEELQSMVSQTLNDPEDTESFFHPDENSEAEEANPTEGDDEAEEEDDEYKEGENNFRESLDESSVHDAIAAHAKIHKETGAMLKKIMKHHKENEPSVKSGWTTVGDAGRTHQQVKEIHDQLFRKGEYAKGAK